MIGGTAYGIGVSSTNGHDNPDLVWPSHPYPPPPPPEPELESGGGTGIILGP